MCTDLMGRSNTASLLYTNDTRVLLDIALRRLTDLAAGDPVRPIVLSKQETEHLLLLPASPSDGNTSSLFLSASSSLSGNMPLGDAEYSVRRARVSKRGSTQMFYKDFL